MGRAGRAWQGLGAAIATFVVAMSAGSFATAAHSEPLDDLLPQASRLVAQPAPVPTPSEGRIPVSLRLADSIWTYDNSHPQTATEVRFELDRSLRLDLSGVPRCPWAPLQRYPAFDWSRCATAVVATGRIKWEVAFPEVEAVRVGDQAVVYRGRTNRLLIRTRIPTPVDAELVIPVKLSRPAGGAYDLKATASIPKIAAGSGSLVYLGLRFRKGLFSMACPQGRFQSRVTNSFVDGSSAATGTITTC